MHSPNLRPLAFLLVVVLGAGCGNPTPAPTTPSPSPSPSAPSADSVSAASPLAIEGYDPVAFFTDSRPVLGQAAHEAVHAGRTYRFASAEHRQLFTADPEKYVPQYGGFCAVGVAYGGLYPVDINTWMVHNNKLYLNKNADAKQAFTNNLDANIQKADSNWPKLKDTAQGS